MKEMMRGSVILTDKGVAKKVGQGWKINSHVGNVFPSVRHGAHKDEMTKTKFVKTKSEAKKILQSLEKIF